MTRRSSYEMLIALLIVFAVLVLTAWLSRGSPAARWVTWIALVLCATTFRLWMGPVSVRTLAAMAAFLPSSFVSICLAPKEGDLVAVKYLLELVTIVAVIWDQREL